MVVRLSAPGKPTKFIDLGPAHGEPTPFKAMRRSLDEAIVYSADHSRRLRVTR